METFRLNGWHRPAPSAEHVDFVHDLEAALHACVEPGTHILLAFSGTRSKGPHTGPFRGVVAQAFPHGFLVRGPAHAIFVAYVDLFCEEGRVAVAEPVWLRDAVSAVNTRFRQRLPRYGAGGVRSATTVSTNAGQLERHRRLMQLM